MDGIGVVLILRILLYRKETMTEKKPRSPQEKKSLSYVNDRRNDYGENDKSSRKAIPARKAGENRKVRRKTSQMIAGIDRLADEQADVVESSIRQDLERVGGWKKTADIPLKSFLERQSVRRSWRIPALKREPEDG